MKPSLLDEGEEIPLVVKTDLVPLEKVASSKEINVDIKTSRDSKCDGEPVFPNPHPKPMQADSQRLASAGGHRHPAGFDFEESQPPGVSDGQDAVRRPGIDIGKQPPPSMPRQYPDRDDRGHPCSILSIWKTGNGHDGVA